MLLPIHVAAGGLDTGRTVVSAVPFVDIVAGVKAFNSPRGSLNGVPFPMLFFIATVMIVAAIGDLRIMRFGVPRGGPRLALPSRAK